MGMISGSRDLLKFWEISANIAEMVVQDLYLVCCFYAHLTYSLRNRNSSINMTRINYVVCVDEWELSHFTLNLQAKFEMSSLIRSMDMAWSVKCRNGSQ